MSRKSGRSSLLGLAVVRVHSLVPSHVSKMCMAPTAGARHWLPSPPKNPLPPYIPCWTGLLGPTTETQRTQLHNQRAG